MPRKIQGKKWISLRSKRSVASGKSGVRDQELGRLSCDRKNRWETASRRSCPNWIGAQTGRDGPSDMGTGAIDHPIRLSISR